MRTALPAALMRDYTICSEVVSMAGVVRNNLTVWKTKMFVNISNIPVAIEISAFIARPLHSMAALKSFTIDALNSYALLLRMKIPVLN